MSLARWEQRRREGDPGISIPVEDLVSCGWVVLVVVFGVKSGNEEAENMMDFVLQCEMGGCCRVGAGICEGMDPRMSGIGGLQWGVVAEKERS